jgi:hypothetical protein
MAIILLIDIYYYTFIDKKHWKICLKNSVRIILYFIIGSAVIILVGLLLVKYYEGREIAFDSITSFQQVIEMLP